MPENNTIRFQIRQIAATLENTIERCNHTLYELRRLAWLLFTRTRADEDEIQAWFNQEGFGIDADGFWTRLPLLEAFRENRAPVDAVSHSWHPDLLKNRDACFRMYCLRGLGASLAEIRSRLPGTAWIYYQDVTNTSIQFPYIDQVTAITPDFDWSTYHTFVSVTPENNPDRQIRWTSPTIDYAGEGLIVSVSIPVYLADTFTGLWSIDLPLKSLYPEDIFGSLLKDQVNFIIDHRGLLVAHPSIQAEIDREKGSIYQLPVQELGPHFAKLDVAELLATGSGQRTLSTRDDNEIAAWFETIPGIQWIFMVTVPRQSLEDEANRQIGRALERIKSGDLSYRIENIADIDRVKLLAEGFNEMASVLESQELIRQRAREEKEKLEQRLQHAQRMESIGTLAGGIAHDFNNILFPIMGHSEMLLADLDPESRMHDKVQQIWQAAARARDLISQILTFSRHGEMQNQAVSLQLIVKEALKLLRSSIPSDITIRKNIRSDCSPVFGDPTKLHQIVMNLCTNAFHAVQDSGGHFEVCLEQVEIEPMVSPDLHQLAPGSYVRLVVSDSGHGMDDETMLQIFDPYFTTKEEGKGTGLGLSVTYGIVRKLSGDIKVYSEPGVGTTFNVYLPAADREAEKEVPNEAPQFGGSERILLVDDEEIVVQMSTHGLRKYGYQVDAHTRSPAALEAFSKDPAGYDLVITDMTMPEMTGDLLARQLKALRKDIPVILYTGFSERISGDDYQNADIDAFLMKPISLKALNQAVRSLLDSPDAAQTS